MIKYYLLILGICSSLFFISKSDFSIVYGDSGFMWIQILDIIQNKFTSFSFKYAGISFDSKGEFLPFMNPFIGAYQGKFYIDFPPYFPLLSAIPRYLLDNNISIYILELVGISAGLFSFFLILNKFTKKISLSLILTLILLFGTTIFTYNLAIHEYSIAIGLLYFGLYFFITSKEKNIYIYYSALLLGLSLYFRLEFIFPIFSWILIALIYKKHSFRFLALRFGILFSIILLLLFFLNQYIHGHPLGFRYLLTMNNPETLIIPRSEIIMDLLFGKLRGFFYQSPYLLLMIGLGILQIGYTRITRLSIHKEQEYYLVISILILLLISFTAPNHGDHISPRYLFGIYPSIFLFGYFTYENILQKQKGIPLIAFQFIILILVLFSVKQLYKNIKFISDSDKLVRMLTDKVNELEEKNVVFLDQVLAKNLQTINYSKNLYYAKPEQVSDFLKISRLNSKEIIFISTEYSQECLSNNQICKDRPSFMNINFYKSSQ